MAIKYGKKRSKQNNIVYTIITAVLLSACFFIVMSYLYSKREAEEYENLHVQTKQVKDDIILQLTSDRENLVTMANFASKLYSDGDDYSLLFESFKSIGMIENIGILNPDNTFSTKAGTSVVDENVLSFEEEKAKGIHISGRIEDITQEGYELIRSAVPIVANGETVGILYGVIKPEKLNERYFKMISELNAQLFVYEKSTGDIMIDTIQDDLGNISFLDDRKYTNGSSYNQLVTTDKGFVSFISAYSDETLYLHYSTIDEFGWMIAMGRYDSQVFKSTHDMAKIIFLTFSFMIILIVLYILVLMQNERKINAVSECAANVRKELLETSDGENNIKDALVEICKFAKSRSAVFFDTNGENYLYIDPRYEDDLLTEEERQRLRGELIHYASELHQINGNAVNVLCIKPDGHMKKTNPSFYEFMLEHNIKEVSFSATINQANSIIILAALNSKRGKLVRRLAEKVSACFSMALYNKNYLNKTILTATTDSLTGTFNRVAYNADIKSLKEEDLYDFSCVYVDVNELHLCNNKYGHAAGDEMLIYVANTLKEAFYGQKVYRMGGDEFLVLCYGIIPDDVKKGINLLHERLKPRDYHVATGMSYRTKNTNTEEMVREAEVRMYEAKAQYYQEKEKKNSSVQDGNEYVHVNTGICEIDTMISVLGENYNGIYRVSLDTDKAKRILMPAYLKYNENEDNFSKLLSKYVDESVVPDYHRAIFSFAKYETLKSQLEKNEIPKIIYKKNNGESVILSVYKLCDSGKNLDDTLWVFAKN